MKIHTLNFCDKKIRFQPPEALDQLLDTISKYTHIENLNLSNNNLHSGHAILIASALEGKFIENLNLSRNHISERGAIAFIGALKVGYIKNIDLSHTNIQDHGAVRFAKALSECKFIESLNLTCNGIRDNGAIALANALNNGPLILNLRYNKIGDKGAIALADVPYIKNLNLLNNNIEFEGNKALFNAILEGKNICMSPLKCGYILALMEDLNLWKSFENIKFIISKLRSQPNMIYQFKLKKEGFKEVNKAHNILRSLINDDLDDNDKLEFFKIITKHGVKAFSLNIESFLKFRIDYDIKDLATKMTNKLKHDTVHQKFGMPNTAIDIIEKSLLLADILRLNYICKNSIAHNWDQQKQQEALLRKEKLCIEEKIKNLVKRQFSEEKKSQKLNAADIEKAALSNDIKTIMLAIYQGCKLDEKDSNGNIPLDYTCHNSFLNAALLLLVFSSEAISWQYLEKVIDDSPKRKENNYDEKLFTLIHDAATSYGKDEKFAIIESCRSMVSDTLHQSNILLNKPIERNNGTLEAEHDGQDLEHIEGSIASQPYNHEADLLGAELHTEINN